MGFLDFVFDNFFIVIIVAIGIINLLSRSAKSKQTEQKQQQRRPERTQTQTRREEPPSRQRPQGHVLGRMADTIENTFEEISNQFEQDKPSETIAEQQKKQYDRLKKEAQKEYADYTREQSHVALKNKQKTNETKNHSPEIGDIDVEHLMSHKGLVQGVIMSEVLGPPRALKPYRSIINERRR